jgi:hypothetical protein
LEFTSGFRNLRLRKGDLKRYNPHELVWARIKNGIRAPGETRIRKGDKAAAEAEAPMWRGPDVAIEKIALPEDQIVTLPAGHYGEGEQEVYLEREYHLYPLPVGFLRHFEAHEAVAEIFGRADGFNDRIDPAGIRLMAGYLAIYDGRNLRDLINPLLTGDVRLELPCEAAVRAFLSVPELRVRKERVPMLITASPFVEGVVEEGGASNIALLRDGVIEESDSFVNYIGYENPPSRQYVVTRYGSNAGIIQNSGVLFNVLPRAA